MPAVCMQRATGSKPVSIVLNCSSVNNASLSLGLIVFSLTNESETPSSLPGYGAAASYSHLGAIE